jgi:hypothetical protein
MPSFFELPPEIRVHIYRLVLEDPTMSSGWHIALNTITTEFGEQYQPGLFSHYEAYSRMLKQVRSNLLVSRQYHSEFVNILYETVDFSVSCGVGVQYFLQQIGPRNRASLKHLEFAIVRYTGIDLPDAINALQLLKSSSSNLKTLAVKLLYNPYWNSRQSRITQLKDQHPEDQRQKLYDEFLMELNHFENTEILEIRRATEDDIVKIEKVPTRWNRIR